MWTFLESESAQSPENHDALLNELYRQMFIVAYAFVRDRTDAMDIVQEAWLKILINIDTLKSPDKIIAWAKTITTNTAINLLRRKSLHTRVTGYEVDPCLAIDEQAAGLEMYLVRKEIWDSIGQLDEESRKIFELKFVYGFTDKEIAAMLELPAGTVKAKVHRGKERLRAELTHIYEMDS
ncbi:RNA polymerase sigma factor [Paenibacillus sp. y28]|uniref:RNA polymerase sigma factor n=1 Tax=Paenibacillus sp. y28 TaxID=3129110 RepID=UPI00301A7A7F